jgi:hypothetical protein
MNRSTLILARHSFSRMRGLVMVAALMLAAFEFLLTQVAGYLFRQSAFTSLSALVPEFLRNAAGPSALAFMSFTGIVAFGYFHPVVIATLVGMTIAIATEPAAEVEMRFVDLTLARPVTRFDVVGRTALVFGAAAGISLLLMLAGTWTGLSCCTPADAPRPAFTLFRSLAVNLAAAMVCWAGVAFALASGARRRATAGGAAGALAVAAYLLDYLGRAWEPARRFSVISPFHYFEPNALVAGQPLNAANIGVLLGIGVAGSLLGLLVFSRRDI